MGALLVGFGSPVDAEDAEDDDVDWKVERSINLANEDQFSKRSEIMADCLRSRASQLSFAGRRKPVQQGMHYGDSEERGRE